MALTCVGCRERINEMHVGFETKARNVDGQWWHRACHFGTTKQFHLTEELFNMQDDHEEDPETAMADLIGDLAQFCKVKGLPPSTFTRALERGSRYAEEEV